MHTHHVSQPSEWLQRHVRLIKPRGRVLDIAAGSGRNARWLAAQGFEVEAVDRDESALQSMQGITNIRTRIADLENGDWPYREQKFDAVIVCRYLHRPLLPLLPDCLEPDGVLVYETFMQGHEAYGRPHNPDFLLEPDELLLALTPALTPVDFEQGFNEAEHAVLQRVCAVKLFTSPSLNPDSSRV